MEAVQAVRSVVGSFRGRHSFLILVVLLMLAPRSMRADALLPTVYHAFTNGVDGSTPQGGLIQASDGNLYGTTTVGGSNGFGVIFRLGLNHVFTPLYSLTAADGTNPMCSLVQGSDGNLYGTANAGGAFNAGTIFRITTNGVFTRLYSFTNNNDGAYPQAGLVQAGDGRLYGTTSGGGSNNSGTVFRITTSGAYSRIYTFSNNQDGGSPLNLVKAGDGSMYGVAYTGGSNFVGGIFHVTTNGAVTPVYSFHEGADGAYPESLAYGNGKLYGSTYLGGTNDMGSIFQWSTNGTLTPVHSFAGGADGSYPEGALMVASDGTLYGTAYFYGNTYFGGTNTEYGNIFRITTNGVYTNLYQFSGPIDGANPQGGLLLASDGQFYGVASAGGADTNGTIFSSPLFPTPANDNFTNRIPLVGVAAGYNIGASLETREPAPGGALAAVSNTVWWSWVAPTNGPVSIVTIGSSFDTIIGVYTGSTISNLSLVASNLITVLNTDINTNSIGSAGITNRLNFMANSGTQYQIQVSGLGSGAIQIAAQTTALKVVSVTPLATNADGSILFNARVEIGNSGSITPGPLQLQVLAHAGATYNLEPPDGPPDPSVIPADIVLTNYTLTSPATVLPGASNVITISGVCPGPTATKQFPADPGNTLGFGWGIFAVLNEQFGTNWFLDDNVLVFYGQRPNVITNPGPQAGVVRLNPSVNGSTPVFQSAQINGPAMVNANSINNYFGTANFVNGASVIPVNFTNTAWFATQFSITTNGTFTTSGIVTNTPVMLSALYSYTYYGQSITNTNQFPVLVLRAASPSLSAAASLANHSFSLTLNAHPSTKFILQTATTLAAPVSWIPLATNTTDANGVWIYIDLGATNRPQRFYRAMQSP